MLEAEKRGLEALKELPMPFSATDVILIGLCVMLAEQEIVWHG